jgi:hypothetical protein
VASCFRAFISAIPSKPTSSFPKLQRLAQPKTSGPTAGLADRDCVLGVNDAVNPSSDLKKNRRGCISLLLSAYSGLLLLCFLLKKQKRVHLPSAECLLWLTAAVLLTSSLPRCLLPASLRAACPAAAQAAAQPQGQQQGGGGARGSSTNKKKPDGGLPPVARPARRQASQARNQAPGRNKPQPRFWISLRCLRGC